MNKSDAFVPAGCVDPSIGRLGATYLSNELSSSEIERFEDHFFRCPACTKELALQQEVVRVTGDLARSRPGRAWIWVLSAALAAGLAGAFFLVPWESTSDLHQSGMRVVVLEPAVRGESPGSATARAGEPLMFRLSVSVPTKIRVTYQVEIVDSSDRVVFVAWDIAPTNAAEVRIAMREGLPRPGRYTVTATEKGPDGLSGPTLHFNIDIVPFETP